MKTRKPKGKKVKAELVVPRCYRDYAEFVNEHRALPLAEDGLKRVQRRIVLTMLKAGNLGGPHSSPAIIGDCIKHYHPHGDAPIYGAMVTMVNDPAPMMIGHGNWGYRGLNDSPAAAARYTKIALSKSAVDRFAPLVKFAATEINENSYSEAISLPTPIPYCLLNGAVGIGVGVSTNIPAFSETSLNAVVKAILEERKPPSLVPICPEGGTLEISPEEVKRLNSEGRCSVRVHSKIEEVEVGSGKQTAFLISEPPHQVNLGSLLKVFAADLKAKNMWMRDESAERIKVLVGRYPKKRLSLEDIRKKLDRCCSSSVSYQCYVSHEGKAKLLPPVEIVKIAVANALKAWVAFLTDKIEKLEDAILFETVKNKLAAMLGKNETEEAIRKKLRLTKEQYSRFIAKPISTLRAKKKDVELLRKELNETKAMLKSPRVSYGGFLGLTNKGKRS